MTEDYYETLGIRRNATADEIKWAYWKQAQEVHPDRNPGAAADEGMKKLNVAYDVLKNPVRRQSYDQTLPPEPSVDIERFTPPDDAPLLPPQLNLPAVDFGSIEQGDGSINQFLVTVENPNDDDFLRPVFKPKKSAFWRTQQIDSRSYRFTVSTYRSEFLEPDAYASMIKVFWDGYPDSVTELPVSMVVEPRQSSSSTVVPPTSRRPSSTPGARHPSKSTSSNARVQAAMSPDREIGTGLLWLLFALVNIAGPMLVMYWTIGGFTATVSGGGPYIIVGPICFAWLLFGVTNCVKMAMKSFKGS